MITAGVFGCRRRLTRSTIPSQPSTVASLPSHRHRRRAIDPVPPLPKENFSTGVGDPRANGAVPVPLPDQAFGTMPWPEARAALETKKLNVGPVQSVAQSTRDPQIDGKMLC